MNETERAWRAANSPARQAGRRLQGAPGAERSASNSGLLSQQFLAGLYRAMRAVNNVAGELLSREFGLELHEFMVLTSIAKGCVYPSAIANRLHASKFAVSRAVQKLTALELTSREVDETDSRRVRLAVTERGAQLRAEAISALTASMEPLLDGIGEEETSRVIDALELITMRLPGGRDA